jgi:homoserine kinase type II
MAVYTEVSIDQVASLLRRLGHARLTALRGIDAGIENTNYYVSSERGEWVLTLFERLTPQQLPFYLRLMQHLARHGLPVPEPQADREGQILHSLCGKPAALVNRLAGQHALAPDTAQCAQMGQMLARLHLAGREFPLSQPHLRGARWWAETVPQVLPFLDAERATLLRDELAVQLDFHESTAWAGLPRGPIHADLFRDNVVFDEHTQQLSGIFDFYFAGVDAWLFDLAVCLNDWCIEPASGRLIDRHAGALCQAYESVRVLNESERRALPTMLRAAALRFWLSRLWDLHLPREATLLQAKDPAHFERVLRERRALPWHAPH